ncbi:right-handed parallel beta-helix repeat-containing protein [Alkalilimnicola sp. S0819]|uniref:right-handed parallel beta-helix repeat-containing protein n=1 Tax=Alkalilimnicola sp. S0819 TaxID=2613922 RepID=UPI001261FD8B|nr:right-handed parallel beta-helix repeat-containing protein [Alkalilimnicola sp. S0819]KAB7622864.1 hypothetical protein F3N43_11115 [Alkalilimnicola sp. S0819]MPQ17186.1 hypothetical protein [Alkalilimnicola sp. S0819]
MRALTRLGLIGLAAGSLYTHSALAAVEIDQLPYIADQAGETYVLSRDLSVGSGRAITIRADNVVIDGQGHTLTYADRGAGNGVYVDYPVSSLEIKNLTLKQGRHEPRSGEDSHAIVATGNHRGLNIHDNTILISRGGAQSGAYAWGMRLGGNSQRSWGNRIAYNTIELSTTSAGYGISLDPNARWQGQIHGNTIRLARMDRQPAGYGRAIALSGRGPVEISDNTIELAADVGQAQAISLWGGSGHIIRNNTIEAASYKTRAILIDGNSDDNRVLDNKIRMNNQRNGNEASAGIRIRYGSDNTMVYRNDIDVSEGNYTIGLRIGESGGYGVPRNTIVRDNRIRSQMRAISVESGSDVVFYNNVAETTGPEWTYALYAYASSKLRFNHDRFQGSVRLSNGSRDISFCATGLQSSDINGTGYELSAKDCGYPAKDVPVAPAGLAAH